MFQSLTMHLTLRVGLDIIMKCSDFVSVADARARLDRTRINSPVRVLVWVGSRMTAEDRDMRFDSADEMLAQASANKYCVESSWLVLDANDEELIGIHVGGQDPAEDDPRYEGSCDEGPHNVDIQD